MDQGNLCTVEMVCGLVPAEACMTGVDDLIVDAYMWFSKKVFIIHSVRKLTAPNDLLAKPMGHHWSAVLALRLVIILLM
jgi:hypothetical protein